ncbi:alpha/beta fold hydrolase [Kitasatospora sp. NPDC088779]|uniref:lipase family alpha/beta hydrolase n=1 Tax=Kitasatospora sp. NPDC088779 TaxID=3154964 RepID=UPI003441A1E7
MIHSELKARLLPASLNNITVQQRRRPSPAWTAVTAGALCLSMATATPASALPAPAAPNQAQRSAYASGPHRPIIFVHGWHSEGAVWNGMKGYAETQGYKESELHVYDYSKMTKPGQTNPPNPGIDHIAAGFAREVNEIAKTSPDGKVDIVAHSMGGLVARAYIKNLGGAEKVKHFVSMGSPHHGTIVADVGVGASEAVRAIGAFLGDHNILVGYAKELAENCDFQCHDMASGSAFLRSLNSGDEAPHGADGYPRYTTFRSNIDDEPAVYLNTRNKFKPQIGLCDGVVFGITEQGAWAYEGKGPNVRGGKTSTLRGAENIVTTCLPHGEYYNDPWTQEKTLDTLAETTIGEEDKYAPRARNRTKCNELTRTHYRDNWVQAWLQSCLQVTPEKEVAPVLRIRGCGHYRSPFGKALWYYTPEGWGDNVECVMGRDGLSLRKKGSRIKKEPGYHKAEFNARAGEVKVDTLSLHGPGDYQLYTPTLNNPNGSPRITVKVQPWDDSDNYTTLDPLVEGPSVTVH